jgi:bacterioferritin (cytochrome b1)
MSDPEPMDVDKAVGALNDALTLQYRSALAYTLLAGSLTGWHFQPLSLEMARFAKEELADARHLVEKIATLGGKPTTNVAALSFDDDPEASVERLIAEETDVIQALKDVIPHTGQEGRSEALEHRLEHMIMRKQEQVDALVRASRSRS